MKTFNRNITFLKDKKGFKSVQKFADHLDEPMGKVREYTRNVFPKEEFLTKLVDTFGVNLNMFLTIELNDSNYSELFTPKSMVSEDAAGYGSQEFLKLIRQLENADDSNHRKALLEELTNLHLSKVDKLKDELVNAYRKAYEAVKL